MCECVCARCLSMDWLSAGVYFCLPGTGSVFDDFHQNKTVTENWQKSKARLNIYLFYINLTIINIGEFCLFLNHIHFSCVMNNSFKPLNWTWNVLFIVVYLVCICVCVPSTLFSSDQLASKSKVCEKWSKLLKTDSACHFSSYIKTVNKH